MQFNSITPKVPYYHEYERVHQNRLAENQVKHLYIPDIGNDEQKKELYESMFRECDMVNLERPYDVLNDEQHRFYDATITAFLDEIGVSWESVIFCLIEERERTQDILAVDLDQHSVDGLLLALDQEKNDTQIQLELSRTKWATVLEEELRMSTPPANRLSRSILALKHFRAERKLSLWHFARRSDVALKLLMNGLPKPNTECPTQDEPLSYSKVICPICKCQDSSIGNCVAQVLTSTI
jgi:hypothetical protein